MKNIFKITKKLIQYQYNSFIKIILLYMASLEINRSRSIQSRMNNKAALNVSKLR
jgi:hypothetical protein